jgi:phytanoyl-CoA hydroxylase
MTEAGVDMEQLRAHWERHGYAVLPGFYTDEALGPAWAAQEHAWRTRARRVVVDDMDTLERLPLRTVDDARRQRHRFKTNDLYLEYGAVREVALNPRLTPIVRELLGQVPVVCNSLGFEHGSEQPDHVDALYMAPETQGHLLAAWIALEDSAPGAGRLRYYPGSHRIEPYVFSGGGTRHVPDEMPAWHAYMQAQVAKLGLQAQQFAARKGDVFLWHAQLYHGGSPIADRTLTRRSLVFHYFSERDCRSLGARLEPLHGGYWVRRSHQPVPGSLRARARGLAAGLRRAWRGRTGRGRL